MSCGSVRRIHRFKNKALRAWCIQEVSEMGFKKSAVLMLLFLSSCVAMADVRLGENPAFTHAQSNPPKRTDVQLITAEELKAKLTRNEPITIIDVRATSTYVDSDDTIKGAIHVKLRRLKTRLAFPPLKNVPRDTEVVTYCACPSDESSVRAAQILLDAGFKRVRALKGGWRMWLKVNGQVERRPKAI